MSFQTITPLELTRDLREGHHIDLIDVRSPDEFAQVHAKGAVNVPLNAISREAIRTIRVTPDNQPIYIICRSGGRSQTACGQLLATGLQNVVNVEGGTLAWEKYGLPLVRNHSGRQNRRWLRPAGLLAVIALLVLGFTIHPLFGLGAAGLWFAMVLTGGCPLCATDPPISSESAHTG